MGKGRKVGGGAGRPDLPGDRWVAGEDRGPGEGVQDTDRQTDRKIQRGGGREGRLDGEDRKDGETRDKWLVA